MTSVDRRLALRLLAIAALAVAIASAVGFVAGSIVYVVSMAGASENDGWAELGAAIFGVVIGGGMAVIAYVVTVVVGVRRTQPAGERARPAVATAALPFAVWGAGGAISAPLGYHAPEPVVAAAAMLTFVAVVVAFGALGGVFRGRRFVVLAAITGSAAVVLVGVAGVVGDRRERDERRDVIADIGTLPLVDGTTIDRPYPDWILRRVDHSSYDRSLDITWDVNEGGDAHLRIDRDGSYEVIVHTTEGLEREEELRSRMRQVSAKRFLEACGRRC
ncbi:MAG TPA: hypothetical protein VM345_03800 [Acidimicrobiales bacterium]|jgi:hypothetical protein|nr:hypothetical protein [Acidimicrobiales bacterium]